nr:MAG TPA: hypothetical protein [Caudoviricetes sp.]DAO77181.1 MAG TPA: hypothetical protein [Caudoviricetes sp.]
MQIVQQKTKRIFSRISAVFRRPPQAARLRPISAASAAKAESPLPSTARSKPWTCG